MSKVIPYFIKIINLNSEHRLCCVLYSVAQSCPTAKPWTVAHQASLSMGILQARILELVAIPFSRDLPNPGIQPRSPILQVNPLPSEPPGKPVNTGAGSLSLLQEIFLTQESNWGPLHCRRILYQLSYQGSLNVDYLSSNLTSDLHQLSNSQNVVQYFWASVFSSVISLIYKVFPWISLVAQMAKRLPTMRET